MAVSLKCWRPKGIPIIVMQRIIPKMACVIAIHNPPVRSQIMFIIIYRHPEALECTLVSLPNGQIASEAILRVWIPKGIPIIVIIRIILPIKYSAAIIMPPKISHTKFPNIFIISSLLFIQE
jgi:hypothetical protein